MWYPVECESKSVLNLRILICTSWIKSSEFTVFLRYRRMHLTTMSQVEAGVCIYYGALLAAWKVSSVMKVKLRNALTIPLQDLASLTEYNLEESTRVLRLKSVLHGSPPVIPNQNRISRAYLIWETKVPTLLHWIFKLKSTWRNQDQSYQFEL